MKELLDPSMVEQLTHRALFRALFSRNNQHVFALDQSKRQSKLWRSSKQESTVARKTTSAHQSGSTVLAYLLTRACTACDPSRNCALASLAGAQLGWCAAWWSMTQLLSSNPVRPLLPTNQALLSKQRQLVKCRSRNYGLQSLHVLVRPYRILYGMA